MIEALIISNIILWVALIALALMIFALTRQVGILHERIAPAGALMPTSGPKVGELTQALELTALNGDAVTIGGVNSGADGPNASAVGSK
jgi:methylamine dehydrogenase accessory protein MauD